jgi:hypothetical protein
MSLAARLAKVLKQTFDAIEPGELFEIFSDHLINAFTLSLCGDSGTFQ